MIGTIVAVIAVLLIIGGASAYIIYSKKKHRCIGCPCAKTCNKSCGCQSIGNVNEKSK